MENLFIIIASLGGLTHTPNFDTGKVIDTKYEDKSEVVTKVYITSTNTDCKVLNPYPTENESIEWNGECKNGYADGEGIVTWYLDGKLHATINGTYYKGTPNGYYTLEWYEDGYTGKYSGEVLDGKRTQGIYTIVDDDNYFGTSRVYYSSGSWKGGKLHGQGEIRWLNDYWWYTGGFDNGRMSGYGVLSLSADENDKIVVWKEKNQGNYQGDRYIIEGIFKDDDLIIECKKENCPAEYFESNN